MKALLVVGSACILALFSMAFQPKINEHETDSAKTAKRPSRVIFIVADGMGLNHVNAARIAKDGKLALDQFTTIGFHQPFAKKPYLPEDYSVATSMACGIESSQGFAGVNAKGETAMNLIDIAAEKGLGTGFITTGNVVDPTMASFSVHYKNGSHKLGVAEKLSDASLDLIIGGGRKYFDARDDEKDVLNWFHLKGFKYSAKLKKNPRKMKGEKKLVLVDDYALNSVERGRDDFLTQAWQTAFHHYSRRGKGFFLVINNAHIAKASFQANENAVVNEVLDLDKTIADVMNMTSSSGGTLVVVTGTYDAGGMTVLETNANNEAQVKWATATSTGNLVPVYAYGQGADQFAGTYSSSELFEKMKFLLEE